MSLSEFLEGASKPLNSNNKKFWSFEKTKGESIGTFLFGGLVVYKPMFCINNHILSWNHYMLVTC